MQADRRDCCVTLAIVALALAACGGDGELRPHPQQHHEPDAAVVLDAGSDATPDPEDASSDAGLIVDDWAPPVVTPPAAGSSEPFLLSQTGLYRDMTSRTLAPDLIAFEPSYGLWSDGADKQRWLRLPSGTQIDTSDMDHWVFPIGSMLFKEFAHAGKRLETRLVMRVGPGADDYFMGAFVWDDAESDARFVPDGQDNVRDSEHDVPRVKQCGVCHRGETGRILGLSAVQAEMLPRERLTQAPSARFVVPGTPQTAAALGYLHANCSHCHNLHGTAWTDTDLDLRLRVSDTTPEATAIYQSARGVMMNDAALRKLRIAPGDPEQSGIYYRMSIRGPMKQMPPVATEHVDDHALEIIGSWIESL